MDFIWSTALDRDSHAFERILQLSPNSPLTIQQRPPPLFLILQRSTLFDLSNKCFSCRSQILNKRYRGQVKMQREIGTDVVIVGAGIAGLAAADHLRQNGVLDVVILEASNRYGGRLHTVPHGDAYLEYGANWIHGDIDDNELFGLARRRSLLPEALNLEDRVKGLFYTSSGQAIDAKLGEKCYDLFFQAESEAGRLFREDNVVKKKLAGKSLQQFLEEEWRRLADKELADADPVQRGQAEAIFNSMILYFRSHVGNDLSLVPATLHGTFENISDGDVKMPNGMRALVDQFYVRLPKNSIHFDTHVTGIFWEPSKPTDGQPAADEWLDHPVRITTDTGVTWKAKHCISTLPLGVLKRSHDKIFHPPLPPLKVEAIESLCFGKVEKIFIEFDQPFWTPGFGGVKLAWTADDLAEKFLPRDWYKVICSFEEVYRQPKILAAWVSGPETEAMHSLSDEQILADCTRVLRTFTDNPAMVAPVRLFRTTWVKNPLFCGSYSSPTFQSSQRSFSDLASPLPSEREPRLCMAGEATHEYYYSTLHAAYMSGIREADRLIPFLQSNRPPLKHKL